MSDRPAPQPDRPDPQQPDSLTGARRLRIRSRLRDVSKVETPRTSRSSAGREADDAELMASLATGDVYALEYLYDRYSSLVFSVSLRVLHDTQLAEDVVQEVFLRLWRQPTSFDPERGRFISWLMSVTRNRALDEQRRVSRRLRVEDQEDQPARELPGGDRLDDPQVGLDVAEQRVAVRAAMTRLPPAQRKVIELAYFGGLTQLEIAERTGDPLGTVKTRIRLGMRKLREALADYIGEGPGGAGGEGAVRT